ncbi:uncharacterized protein BP5553_03789 [Venustampulla echinocandica]|uniref:BTB domain-containing protein n=1 Tax=Venustampulla echinocandica TaxID=2656787 RepID=A0A370TVC1_9HELO|nr:uncharacterized protein BP5553_03789 [Venustampulla echinocandica]RDL39449.1 hypothetical protein BP5553_03789 [Venustampulla echinocandica]
MDLFNLPLRSRGGYVPPPSSHRRHVNIGMEIPFHDPLRRRRGMLEFPEPFVGGSLPRRDRHRVMGPRTDPSPEMGDPCLGLAAERRKPSLATPAYDEYSFYFPDQGPDCHTSRPKYQGHAPSLQTRLPIPPQRHTYRHAHFGRGCSPHHHCGCGGGSNYSSEDKFSFKTKDICVRGKAYKVRSSYLAEAPKFETDLIKYLDKKIEEVVPQRVVRMLVDFINYDDYNHEGGLLDEAKLNILATNVGAKSVIDFSLDFLKQNIDCDVQAEDLCDIVTTVMMSDGVGDGLKEWLKKYLTPGQRLERLFYHESYAELMLDHPEVETKLEILLGVRRKEDDGKYKAM